jgi:hypothetical protein
VTRDAEPRVGTVTMDVVGAVKGAKGGSVEFRVEKAGIVHGGVGKASFTEDALVENIKAFVDAVAKAKPQGAKGTYIKKVSLSSTMGPGVKVDTGSIPRLSAQSAAGGRTKFPGVPREDPVPSGSKGLRRGACPRLMVPGDRSGRTSSEGPHETETTEFVRSAASPV